MTEQERLLQVEKEVSILKGDVASLRAQQHGPHVPPAQPHVAPVISVVPGTPGKRIYGFRPDLPDQRDYTFSSLNKQVKLPTNVDLRKMQSPVKDQGNLGSCTSFSLTGAVEALEIKDKKTLIPMSQLFVYYNERVLEGTTGSDAGASLRDGIKALATRGSCPETVWPYIINKFSMKPPQIAYTDGLQYIIQSYYRILTLNDMKTCLSLGFPFIFGITVYSSFESPAATSSGIIPMPSRHERVQGGHALLAVGFDDSKQWFIFKNSWSAAWGNSGYGFIPYNYLTNSSLSSDMWYISKEKNL